MGCPIGVKLPCCAGGAPHPRATARVPSPHPHRTRPYKDTEQLILLRRLCKGGGGVERSGDPCGRPGVGVVAAELDAYWAITYGCPRFENECVPTEYSMP